MLVTGYNGFIGSNLIEELEKKHNLIGISNQKGNKQSFTQIRKDIRKLTAKEIPNDISHIVHLAAITDVSYCQSHPLECFGINIGGTINMLEIARKIDAKFVFLSTSHVYGIPMKTPIREDHPRIPTSVYSSSKFAGEVVCESYSRSYGLDLSIARLFSVYGPRSPIHLVTSKIITQSLKSDTISLGNLHPQRDFIYVKDAIRAIELVLKKTNGFQIFNIGTGKCYSILDLCNILKKITGKKLKIKSVKSQTRKGEIDKVLSDSTKIRRLGWKPLVDINKGLELTLNWYKSLE